jgi:hypothetical protein
VGVVGRCVARPETLRETTRLEELASGTFEVWVNLYTEDEDVFFHFGAPELLAGYSQHILPRLPRCFRGVQTGLCVVRDVTTMVGL